MIKADFGYTIGNILIKGINFITLPIFSRILTTDEFSVYNIFLIGVLIYKLCKYVCKRNKKYLTGKQVLLLLVFAVIFIYAFGAIGDFRTISIFQGGGQV